MQKQKSTDSLPSNLTEHQLISSLMELLNPENDSILKIKSKQFFSTISLALHKVEDLIILQRIAKFLMALIFVGHIHILRMFDQYLLKQIVNIADSIFKLSSYLAITDKDQHFQPNRWKNKFARQVLFLLAQWFPYDFINVLQQSKYVKIIKNRNLKKKGFLIINNSLVKEVEEFIENLNLENENKCSHCVRCYEKLKNEQISSPLSSENTKATENPTQIQQRYAKSQIEPNISTLIEPSRLRQLKQRKKQQRNLVERMRQKMLKNKSKKQNKEREDQFH